MSKSFGGNNCRPGHKPKSVVIKDQIPIEKKEPRPIEQPIRVKKRPAALYFDIDPDFIDEDGYVELKIPAPKFNPELYRLKLSWELK